MVARQLDHAAYGWHENKGYGSPDHVDALRRLGPTVVHRRSWRLPSGTAAPAPGTPDEGGVGRAPTDVPAGVPAPVATAAPTEVAAGWAMMDA